MTREFALQLIRECIDDINSERERDATITFSDDLPLYGLGSLLDSLEFVNFTVGLEERLRLRVSTSIDLASVLFDESAGEPFRSAGALADYLVSRRET